MTNAKDYYEKIVLDYIVGDVNHLLDIKESRSGIILSPVVNGIDTIGGMIYGFKTGSKIRFIDVLCNYMSLERPVAIFLYESLRCGLVHQGTSKVGLRFFTLYGQLNRNSILYAGGDDWVYLDSTALAIAFCEMARSIREDHAVAISFLPPFESSSFDKLNGSALPPISDLIIDYAADQTCAKRWIENGKIHRVTTSTSYYTPDQVLNQDLVIDPCPYHPVDRSVDRPLPDG